MSGHSKWSQIKRQKGINDVKRSGVFTKIGFAITLAAKTSNDGNPDTNPRLRMAIETARGVNMPKENIQRAIDKGLGKLPGQSIEEVLYEGFGPGRVAFLVEGITDNRLRTNAEIRNLFERNGGNMGNVGSVSYMFDKVGELKIEGKSGDKDEEMLELIDLGAQDVEDFLEDGKQMYLVYVQSPELNTMSTKLTQSWYRVESAQLVFKPNTLVEIDEKEVAEKLMEFLEKLESNEDVQNVYYSAVFPDDLTLETKAE
jgi:YebC/PmpR family DNA-binding regulatory protein